MCDCRRRRQRGEIVENLLDFFDIVLAACFIESSAKSLLFIRKIFKINFIGSRKRAQRKINLKTFITTQFSLQQIPRKLILKKKIVFYSNFAVSKCVSLSAHLRHDELKTKSSKLQFDILRMIKI